MADEVSDVTAPHWLDDEEQRAWLAYRHMTRQLEAHLARRLSSDSGLSMQDYDVLSALTDPPDRRLCLKDLGNHLLWSPSRLSHHLDRMQRRGLVRRAECPDGRGNDVVLTAQGLDAIVTAAPAHVAAVRAAFIDVVSREDLAVLGRLSTTVLAELRSRSG